VLVTQRIENGLSLKSKHIGWFYGGLQICKLLMKILCAMLINNEVNNQYFAKILGNHCTKALK
jgi:hypothetical protein